MCGIQCGETTVGREKIGALKVAIKNVRFPKEAANIAAQYLKNIHSRPGRRD